MTSVLGDPGAGSRGEWRFPLFGVPVRVNPWFWITTVFLGLSDDLGTVLIWVSACFVSILLHELGHVAAFRMFGIRAEAVLYAWGGLAIPDRDFRRRGTLVQVAIAAAGPLAGFCLAAAVLGVAAALGARVDFRTHLLVIPSITAVFVPTAFSASGYLQYQYANLVVQSLLYINIFWGLVNLLPIYPLDGGQISRALLQRADPVRGRRRSLLLSAAVGAVLCLVAFLGGSMYTALFFGILAAGSLQAIDGERPAFRPGPSRDWRG